MDKNIKNIPEKCIETDVFYCRNHSGTCKQCETDTRFDNLDMETCSHEFISKEYPSQPFGTCLGCGQTLINLK